MNYKELSQTATQWQRCKAVTIVNPLEDAQPKTAYFSEETIVELPGQSPLKQDVGSCFKEFSPNAEIQVLDLSTGLPNGETITHAKLYQILYSLYIATATERDASL